MQPILRTTVPAVVACLLSGAAVLPQSRDPQPQDATKAILAAFDKYDVVGMSAAHSNKLQDDFILSLVRNPALVGTVNDIAVECGNSRYQAILDRYIAGDDVPMAEARQVWRNTSVAMCSLSGLGDARERWGAGSIPCGCARPGRVP